MSCGARRWAGPSKSMEIEVLECGSGLGSRSRDFFSKKEEEREAWDALVARLSDKLGKERVFVAFPKRALPARARLLAQSRLGAAAGSGIAMEGGRRGRRGPPGSPRAGLEEARASFEGGARAQDFGWQAVEGRELGGA